MSINYTLTEFAQRKLSSTCCHKVLLEKDGLYYWGVYNGLSFWGRVEYNAEHIETLFSEGEYLDDGEYLESNFDPVDFIEAGYTIID